MPINAACEPSRRTTLTKYHNKSRHGVLWRCRVLDSFVPRAQFLNDVVLKFRYLDSVNIEARGDISASYRVVVILHNLIACETQSTQASVYYGAELPFLEDYCALLNVMPAEM